MLHPHDVRKYYSITRPYIEPRRWLPLGRCRAAQFRVQRSSIRMQRSKARVQHSSVRVQRSSIRVQLQSKKKRTEIRFAFVSLVRLEVFASIFLQLFAIFASFLFASLSFDWTLIVEYEYIQYTYILCSEILKNILFKKATNIFRIKSIMS